jgi:hypothetical protein
MPVNDDEDDVDEGVLKFLRESPFIGINKITEGVLFSLLPLDHRLIGDIRSGKGRSIW